MDEILRSGRSVCEIRDSMVVSRVERSLVSLETAWTTNDISQNAAKSKPLVAASSERQPRGGGRTTDDRIPAQRHGFRT